MKFKKSIITLMAPIASIATTAALVSCGADKPNIDKQIVYYYDGSQAKSGKIVERMKILEKEYNKNMDAAVKSGKIKNRIKLVLKKGISAYDAPNKMMKTWGANDYKSPDLWFGAQADMKSYKSKNGTNVQHLFENQEYDEFWNASGFQTGGQTTDKKTEELHGKIDNKVTTFRTSLPWFGKGFFNIEYDPNDSTGGNYDSNKNTKYANGTIKLGSTSMPIDSTLIGMNNAWNHNPFSNAIFEYLRGNMKDSDNKAYKKNNADGYSNTIADTAFINKSGSNLGSILFSKKTGETSWDPTDISKLDLTKPSQLAVAWMQMIQENLAKDLKDNSQNMIRNNADINSINYWDVSTTFRGKSAEDVAANIDKLTVQAFMGVSKSGAKNKTIDTQGNDHKYTNLLGAGIDWVKFMDSTIRNKKLNSTTQKDADIEKTLSHYHIYRMPKTWQMDNASTTKFPLLDSTGKYSDVTKLDGLDIAGVNDGVATDVDITPMEDGDFINFNQRTWDIKDPALKKDKISALKIFLGALYNKQGDEEYAKLLFQDQGTFSSNQKLRELGAPKKVNGKWKSQKDRLWDETARALATIDPSEQKNAKVNSDWTGWGGAYWGGGWTLDKHSEANSYETAKNIADNFKNAIAKITPSDKKKFKENNKHLL